jgi:hypothetical protein
MLIGIKRKLKLNNSEVTYFRKCSEYARFVWNYIYDMMLGVKDDNTSCSKKLDAIKKIFTNHVKNSSQYSWIESDGYPSMIYQMEFKFYSAAMSDFFKGLKNPPSRKCISNGRSFTTYSGNGTTLPGIEKYETLDKFGNILNAYKKIKVPGLGTLRLQEHIVDLYPGFELISQTFTISESADGWYVSFNVEVDSSKLLDYKKKKFESDNNIFNAIDVLGCDLGVKTFCVGKDRDGNKGL